MPIRFQKSLQECLPRIKKSTPQIGLPPPRTLSSSTSWILRGCKHPKTSSFACDDDQKENEKQEGDDNAATLSDIDRFLLENFKSLYKNGDEGDTSENSEDDNEALNNEEDKPGGVSVESPRFMDPPENIRGSCRFFVAPGSSSSLMEEARTSLTIPCTTSSSTSEDMVGSAATSVYARTSSSCNDSARTSDSAKEALSPDDFITVLTFSTSPYDDFKKSMQEMIDARLKHNGKIDWEFMEELLFCYLNLNEKKSYRFILRAFVDIIVVLRENSGRIVPAKPRNVRSNSGSGTSERK